ncbi:MAG: leucine-rich repeat domain-containing protein [archaeon]|nr:leucine-rich repeat domain-containing protein [archaeon]
MYSSLSKGSSGTFRMSKGTLCAAILVFIAALLMLFAFNTSDSSSAEPEQIGTSNCYWEYDSLSGTLIITGTGAIPDFTEKDPAPWGTDITAVSVGNGITVLGEYSFEKCSRLTTVSLPDTLVEIRSYAFHFCTALTEIELPDSLVTIKGRAFEDSGLITVNIPNSVEDLGMAAFMNCTELERAAIGNLVPCLQDKLFYNCSKLQHLTVGTYVWSIGDDVFYSCNVLSDITNYSLSPIQYGLGLGGYIDKHFVRDSSVGLGTTDDGKFAATYNVKSGICQLLRYYGNDESLDIGTVTIGEVEYQVHRIGAAVENMDKLEIFKDQDLLRNNSAVIEEVDELKSITFGDNIKKIDNMAVYNCYNLVSVKFGTGLRVLGYSHGNEAIYCQNDKIHTVLPNITDSVGDAKGWLYHMHPEYGMIKAYDGHTAGEPVVGIVKEPTCTESGIKGTAVFCTVCGYTLAQNTDEVIKALGHDYVKVNGTESSCTSKGLTDGEQCTRCRDWKTPQTELPLKPHVWGVETKEDVIPATCAAAGSYKAVVRCTACEEIRSSETKEIPIIPSSEVTSTGGNYVAEVTDDKSTISSADVTTMKEAAKTDSSVTLKIDTSTGSIVLDNTALKNLKDGDAAITLGKDTSGAYEAITGPGATVFEISIGDNHDNFAGGKIKVTVPYSGPTEGVKLYCVSDGKLIEPKDIDFSEAGYASFELDHLSIYSIQKVIDVDAGDNGSDSNNTLMFAIIGIIAVVAIVGVVALVKIKKA